MAASQNHGFLFEKPIKDAFYPGAPDQGYSDEYDVAAGYSVLGHHPVQIKCATAASLDSPAACIMLGDARRNFRRSQDFEMIVADLAQNGDSKHARRYVRLVFEHESYHHALFGTLPTSDIEALDASIKAIPKGAQTTLRLAAHAKKNALKSQYGFGADLQAKISTTGSQRRLQASCSLDALISAAKSVITIEPKDYLTHNLPASIISPRRKRHPKPTIDIPFVSPSVSASMTRDLHLHKSCSSPEALGGGEPVHNSVEVGLYAPFAGYLRHKEP